MKNTYKILSAMLLIMMLVSACAKSSDTGATQTAAAGAGGLPGTTTVPGGGLETPTTSTGGLPTTAITATQEMTATTMTPGETPVATTAITPTTGTGGTGQIDCMGAKSGDQVTVMYQWSGQEEQKFNDILAPFVQACGVKVVANSNRDAAVLDAAVKSTPPDVLFWPDLSPIKLYKDKLKPLTGFNIQTSNYADYFLKLGTVDGQMYALPIKTDVKSIVWYSPAQFQAAGYQVPKTFDELNTLVEKMVSDGKVPWSMGMENAPNTGWTGSDFIQDLLLTQQGPDYVNKIISGEVPYNDPGVQQAYETYKKWASDPKYTVGGANGTLTTNVGDAILKVFSDPPEAMMVKQSGFAGQNIVTQYPNLKYGTDFDFFLFPGIKGLQGGYDLMYSFNDSPGAKALIGYLTSQTGVTNWAKSGLGLSPNKLSQGQYTDPQQAKMSEFLFTATGFTPDIGDTLGAPFGEAEWKAIINVVQGQDIKTNLDTAAAAQKQALGK